MGYWLGSLEKDIKWGIGSWPRRDLNLISSSVWDHQKALPKTDRVSTTAHASPACFHVTWGAPQPDLDFKGGLDIKDLKRQE